MINDLIPIFLMFLGTLENFNSTAYTRFSESGKLVEIIKLSTVGSETPKTRLQPQKPEVVKMCGQQHRSITGPVVLSLDNKINQLQIDI